MRILHVVHQYLPDRVGGTENYTKWLTEALSRRGHDITVFYRRSADGMGLTHRTQQNVDIWAAWAGKVTPTGRFRATFRDPQILCAFERVLERADPDLVHIQHLMGLPTALVRAIQRRRIPYVITLWDFWWMCANAQLLTNYDQQVCDGPEMYVNCAQCALARIGQSWLWPAIPALAGLLAWRNRALHQVINSADQLVAPAEFVRSRYATHGIPKESIIVIPPGLEYSPRNVRRERRQDGPLRFTFVGGLAWQKGVHILLEAFGRVRGTAELWIAGDESFDPDYVSCLHDMTSPGVRFLGRQSREDVWKTLAQTDIVVMPSLWQETFSFSISEAFAVGVPVIASHQGALVDRIRDGVDGLLVEPGDVTAWCGALQSVIEDRNLLNRLRANVSQPMAADEHAKEMEDLYNQLVSPI